MATAAAEQRIYQAWRTLCAETVAVGPEDTGLIQQPVTVVPAFTAVAVQAVVSSCVSGSSVSAKLLALQLLGQGLASSSQWQLYLTTW